MNRVRSAALNGTVGLISLCLALGVAEIAVRVAAPQQLILKRPDVWKPRDTLGWEHRPNVNTTINTGERTVQVRTDADGFRIGRNDAPAGGSQVLLIGDSFAEALQVEFEQSFAGLLQEQLAIQLGHPVRIRDAGVSGWDPPQYLYRASELLKRNHYDLVIVALYLGNDLIPKRDDVRPPRDAEPVYRFRLPRHLTWSEAVNAFVRPIDDVLKTQSQLFILVKNRSKSLRKQVGLAPVDYPVGFLRSDGNLGLWSVTTQVCTDLAEVAGKAGVPIFFVLLPTSFQVDTTIVAEQRRVFHIPDGAIDLDQPARILSDSLRHRGIRVVDALPALRAAHQTGGKLFGQIDSHLSPRGHEVVARLLMPVVGDYLSTPASRERFQAVPVCGGSLNSPNCRKDATPYPKPPSKAL